MMPEYIFSTQRERLVLPPPQTFHTNLSPSHQSHHAAGTKPTLSQLMSTSSPDAIQNDNGALSSAPDSPAVLSPQSPPPNGSPDVKIDTDYLSQEPGLNNQQIELSAIDKLDTAPNQPTPVPTPVHPGPFLLPRLSFSFSAYSRLFLPHRFNSGCSTQQHSPSTSGSAVTGCRYGRRRVPVKQPCSR